MIGSLRSSLFRKELVGNGWTTKQSLSADLLSLEVGQGDVKLWKELWTNVSIFKIVLVMLWRTIIDWC